MVWCGWVGLDGRPGVGNAGLRRPTAGDHQGPPLVHPTALAPTESSIEAEVDASWVASVATESAIPHERATTMASTIPVLSMPVPSQ